MSNKRSFEDKMKELEEIISSLENGEFGLDEMVEKYSYAMKLVNECDKSLKSVEERISKIVTDEEEKDFKVEE